MNRRSPGRWVVAGVLMGMGPLIGAWAAGFPLARYFEFPPISRYVEAAGFAWPVFLGLAVVEAVALVFLGRLLRPVKEARLYRFPGWGRLGIVALAFFWLLAWTRFEWFAWFQTHTFTPLWLSYIVVVNALTHRRAGHCLLIREWRGLPALFAASAAFWWFFEYLNRFVQNWRYLGLDAFSPLEYCAFATLAFSTVLPAVLSTEQCLRVHGWGRAADRRSLPPIKPGWRKAMMTVSSLGIVLVGVYPAVLYPMLWLAPLGIVLGLTYGVGPLERLPAIGTWCRLAAAALICGFFWELWNWHSQAKWVYQVSYVGRFKIFEMPVLGYFGYVPFGWECGLVALLLPSWRAFLLRR